jgi:hypothetical protein
MNLEPTMVGGSDALDVNMTTRKPIRDGEREAAALAGA